VPATTTLPSAGETTSPTPLGTVRSGSLKKYIIKKVEARPNKAGRISPKSEKTKVVNAAAPIKEYPGLAIGNAL
jgi:hypothetical protein